MSKSELPLFFRSFSEIEARENYDPNCQISLDNFKDVVGRYHFHEEDEQHCQVLKPDGYCRTEHQRGWLGVTTLGQEALIGRDCARKYFNQDDRFIRLTNQVDRELNITSRLNSLSELLNDRQKFEDTLGEQSRRLRRIQSVVTSLETALPDRVIQFLHQTTKTGNKAVTLQLKYEETNERGDKDVEWVSHALGSLVGTEIWKFSQFGDCHRELSEIKKTLSELQLVREAGETKLKKWLDSLNGLSDQIKKVDELESALKSFTQTDNLHLLVFLVSDPNEKIQIAKLALAQRGNTRPSNNDARKLINQLLQAISSSIGGRVFREYF